MNKQVMSKEKTQELENAVRRVLTDKIYDKMRDSSGITFTVAHRRAALQCFMNDYRDMDTQIIREGWKWIEAGNYYGEGNYYYGKIS